MCKGQSCLCSLSPHTPGLASPGTGRGPCQGWFSHACSCWPHCMPHHCLGQLSHARGWELGRALPGPVPLYLWPGNGNGTTGADFIASMATSSPTCPSPLGFPWPWPTFCLHTPSLLRCTGVLQGSLRSRLLWLANTQRWGWNQSWAPGGCTTKEEQLKSLFTAANITNWHPHDRLCKLSAFRTSEFVQHNECSWSQDRPGFSSCRLHGHIYVEVELG